VRRAQLSRSAPIEVLNILLRIILAPAIDEPLTSYPGLSANSTL